LHLAFLPHSPFSPLGLHQAHLRHLYSGRDGPPVMLTFLL
jgi:hypothetical protein